MQVEQLNTKIVRILIFIYVLVISNLLDVRLHDVIWEKVNFVDNVKLLMMLSKELRIEVLIYENRNNLVRIISWREFRNGYFDKMWFIRI